MNNNAYLTVRALIHNWESRERKTKVKIYKKNKKSSQNSDKQKLIRLSSNLLMNVPMLSVLLP